MEYTHPMYTAEALASQAELPALSGPFHTFFCGSYHRWGFHEDAVASALAVCSRFGLSYELADLRRRSEPRPRPVRHVFRYPLYWYAFDLDELPELHRRIALFGHNRIRRWPSTTATT